MGLRLAGLGQAIGRAFRKARKADEVPDARTKALNMDLHAAVRGGSPEAVREFLRTGADPNARNDEGHTALHTAAAFGSPEIVRTLLTVGACTVWSSLRVAAALGKVQNVCVFLAAGADPNRHVSSG